VSNEPLMQVVATAARGYYFDTSCNPSYALPAPTPAGTEIFAQFILDRVFAPGVMSRAMEAARDCDVRTVHDKSVLQQRLFDALLDFLPQIWKPHPRNGDKARAAAEVMVAEVGPAVEKQAFEVASRRQHMTEGELQQEEAWGREAEIERNRRRPGRRPLYFSVSVAPLCRPGREGKRKLISDRTKAAMKAARTAVSSSVVCGTRALSYSARHCSAPKGSAPCLKSFPVCRPAKLPRS
jgi:hypothetical protein